MSRLPCPKCDGERLNPESRFVTINGKRLPELTSWSIEKIHSWISTLSGNLSREQIEIGEELIKALPEGGKIAIFVGTLDAQNARDRRQGILDVIKDSGVPIEEAACKLDEADRGRAKQNVEDVIASIAQSSTSSRRMASTLSSRARWAASTAGEPPTPSISTRLK